MRTKIVFTLILISFWALSLPSCYYDNEEELYSGNSCDTTAVSYASDIVPILQNNCYGCHDASNFSTSGTQFDQYALIKILANNGKLTNRTNSVNAPMPPTALMDDCNRVKIKAWVDAGAPQN
jgi:hypothetical protein